MMSNNYCDFSNLPIMLNANDISKILGVSRAFAYNLFHAAGFPVTVIGKRRLVNKNSFINWLSAQETEVV